MGRLAGSLLALLLGANAAGADIVFEPPFVTGFGFRCLCDENATEIVPAPWGQSFTAVGEQIVAISLFYSDSNAFVGEAHITVDVFAGEGYGGPLLGSVTRDLGGQTTGFVQFGFANVATLAGSLYAFRVSSASSRGEVATFQHALPTGEPLGPDYAGGHLLDHDGAPLTAHDMVFAIDDTPMTVPEPGSGLLLGGTALGLLLATGCRRRGRRR